MRHGTPSVAGRRVGACSTSSWPSRSSSRPGS
jgi:hypothetical protein